MGRRAAPADPSSSGLIRLGAVVPPLIGRRLLSLLALLTGSLVLVTASLPASAQTVSQRIKSRSAKETGDQARMLVEAQELVYNEKTNTVEARGDVQINYQGRLLEADRVIYNRTTNRVYAEGHARLTEADGTVLRADRFDFTEDFKNGFVESLRVTGSNRTYFSSPRAERSEGETTTFENGTYTACEPCKDNPDRPPLWQVRAKRIIHKNDEQMVYYEDATLAFLGIPIAYVPFFSAPDPTVKRKSGLLAPHFVYKPQLGFGVGVPIFWDLAPNYDLTFTPTALVETRLSRRDRVASPPRERLVFRAWHRHHAAQSGCVSVSALWSGKSRRSRRHRKLRTIQPDGQMALRLGWCDPLR